MRNAIPKPSSNTRLPLPNVPTLRGSTTRSELLIGQLRLDLAEKEFRDAWKENPNDALTNLYLGDIAVRDQRFSEAFRFLLVAQRGQPNMSQVHFLLGKCYLGQNEPEKAKAELLAAINADPATAEPHYLVT